MAPADAKVLQYLSEAHASEQALVSVLTSQIAMTPKGSFRDGLETHLDETRGHAQRVGRRIDELGGSQNPLVAAFGLAETLIGQILAFTKTPLDLVRGSGGEEKVLKNAKDACATEALEIATYTALARLARGLGDAKTADLAESILADEQRMLERVLGELEALTDAVALADVEGESTYDVAETGAADAVKAAAGGKRPARKKRAAKKKAAAKRRAGTSA